MSNPVPQPQRIKSKATRNRSIVYFETFDGTKLSFAVPVCVAWHVARTVAANYVESELEQLGGVAVFNEDGSGVYTSTDQTVVKPFTSKTTIL